MMNTAEITLGKKKKKREEIGPKNSSLMTCLSARTQAHVGPNSSPLNQDIKLNIDYEVYYIT